ncbi:MAG TPA: ABC transporter substrate-binding protein [Gaiellaceae bacterium]
MFRVVCLDRRGLVGLLLGIAALTLSLVGFAGAASTAGSEDASAQFSANGFTSAKAELFSDGALMSSTFYPRAQSLITSGTQWGTIQGFNPYFGAYAIGTVGLCNETLLRYDPLKDRYINWLARSAKFTGAKTYTVEVRPGIKWSNGQKFTGKDVAFNFKLGRFSNAFWHDQYGTLKSIKVKGLTVTFAFKGTPDYAQWQHLIWNLPMVNPGQARTIRSAATLESYGQQAPIGTGPYTLASLDPTTRVVWQKKAVWWAAQQKLAPSPKPTYVIDLAGSCPWGWVECNSIEDLANSYAPGIKKYVESGEFQTYFPKAPYNLSANTLWLTPNTKHKPLDDKAFRRALATSIDVGSIVTNDYQNQVLPANATGLLPTWKKWVDQKQLKSLGFSYDPAKARSLLATAGYKDVNGDGYVENRDGSPINLKLAAPSGWSDWETAEGLIVNSAKAAGIHLTVVNSIYNPYDFNRYVLERNSGTFDLVIDSTPQIGDNPWSYFDFLFHLPVFGTQTSTNFSRYVNPKAWNLVKKLDMTPLDKAAARKSLMSQLEKIELADVPNIPLWYGGVWAISQSKFWTNWPSSDSKRNYFPTMARGYMQMTGIDMITHLEPA